MNDKTPRMMIPVGVDVGKAFGAFKHRHQCRSSTEALRLLLIYADQIEAEAVSELLEGVEEMTDEITVRESEEPK